MNAIQASLLTRSLSRSGVGRDGGRVLIAEDDPFAREALGELLSDEGFEVVGLAANGAEAVAMTQQAEPEVVVSDVQMPVMNGLEATRSIKRLFPEIQVVILSGNSDPVLISEAEEAGAYEYLHKSGSWGRIAETVANARACRALPARLG